MKIYTKTGDLGMTGLFGGKRVKKNDPRIEAYGTVDELNSALGIILTEDIDKKTSSILSAVQQSLFTIGSELATPVSVKEKLRQIISTDEIEFLEKSIDEIEGELAPLKNFVLPGGKRSAAYLHFARTICRRAERKIVEINSEESINPYILVFINRLSDLLFVASRYENYVSSVPEVLWNSRG